MLTGVSEKLASAAEEEGIGVALGMDIAVTKKIIIIYIPIMAC